VAESKDMDISLGPFFKAVFIIIAVAAPLAVWKAVDICVYVANSVRVDGPASK